MLYVPLLTVRVPAQSWLALINETPSARIVAPGGPWILVTPPPLLVSEPVKTIPVTLLPASCACAPFCMVMLTTEVARPWFDFPRLPEVIQPPVPAPAPTVVNNVVVPSAVKFVTPPLF